MTSRGPFRAVRRFLFQGLLLLGCRGSVEPDADKLALVCVEHPHELSAVASLRELSVQRSIVSDAVDRDLVMLDFDSLSAAVVSKQGRGPGELEFPTAVLPLPSESTLVFDAGARRYAVLNNKFVPIRTFDLADAGIRVAAGQRIAFPPKATDMFGNIYFERPDVTRDGPLLAGGDSATVMRFSAKAHTVSPVARIRVGDGFIRSASAGKSFSTRIGFVNPYAAADGWNVLPDGRVAIVRAEPYHVEYVGLDGRTVVGPPITVDRLPVTARDRNEVLGLQSRRPGRRSAADTSAAGRALDEAEAGAWPAEKPAFSFVGIYARANGELWVLRHTREGFSRVVLDVFGTGATRDRRVELPGGSVILGLTQQHAYLARMTPDDLQIVRRCTIPPRS